MAEKKGRGKIAALVESLVAAPIAEAGYLLWDVDFYKEGADYNLLVTIEHPDPSRGIDLQDCETVTRLINPILDEKDPIEDFYYLEVSSAGLERELSRPQHFAFFLRSPVRVKLYAPRNGKKVLEGTLLSYEDGLLTLFADGENLSLGKEEYAKVTTIYDGLE